MRRKGTKEKRQREKVKTDLKKKKKLSAYALKDQRPFHTTDQRANLKYSTDENRFSMSSGIGFLICLFHTKAQIFPSGQEKAALKHTPAAEQIQRCSPALMKSTGIKTTCTIKIFANVMIS